MKHTPGPWTIHPYGEAVLGNGKRICLTTPPGVSMTDEKMANAVLIAAAPEMLEVLTAIQERLAKDHLILTRDKAKDLADLIWAVMDKATSLPPIKKIVKGCDNCGYAHINHKRCDSPEPCTNGSQWTERKE